MPLSIPTVSVIIPVYNVAEYLPRCLESVLAQTFTDYEIICINDGSSDDSGSILHRYSQENKKIRIIEQENMGLSMARNNALKCAVGQYVFFLDSDDYIHPQTLEICVSYAKQFNAEMVQADILPTNEGELPSSQIIPESIRHHVTDQPLYLTRLDSNAFQLYMYVCGKLYKRELLNGLEFVPGLVYEDIPYTYAVCLMHPRTVCLKCNLYSYTVRPGSLCHAVQPTADIVMNRVRCIEEVCHRMEQYATEEERQFMILNFIPRNCNEIYKECRNMGEPHKREALSIFAKELRALYNHGYLYWRGHKLRRYWMYRWIMMRFV